MMTRITSSLVLIFLYVVTLSNAGVYGEIATNSNSISNNNNNNLRGGGGGGATTESSSSSSLSEFARKLFTDVSRFYQTQDQCDGWHCQTVLTACDCNDDTETCNYEEPHPDNGCCGKHICLPKTTYTLPNNNNQPGT
jgi:hypothetical protein